MERQADEEIHALFDMLADGRGYCDLDAVTALIPFATKEATAQIKKFTAMVKRWKRQSVRKVRIAVMPTTVLRSDSIAG